MAAIIDNGTKVEYLYLGKWNKGVVHGIKTHEEPNGIITRVAYLIDTGKTIREDVGEVDEKGTPTKVHRQPEQIEIEQQFVRLA